MLSNVAVFHRVSITSFLYLCSVSKKKNVFPFIPRKDKPITSASQSASANSVLHHMSGCSMPNTPEGQGAHVSGPAEPSGLQRPTDVAEEERGLISSLARDAARVRRASSAELHLPWTCPVTHSREKFYTVCSDYALLNQAASVYHPPNTARDVVPNKQDDGPSLVKPKPSADLSAGQSGGAHVGSDGDCDMVEVSSGHTKPILAWEIDTTDFNAVLMRKTRTSKKLNITEACLYKCIQSVRKFNSSFCNHSCFKCHEMF